MTVLARMHSLEVIIWLLENRRCIWYNGMQPASWGSGRYPGLYSAEAAGVLSHLLMKS